MLSFKINSKIVWLVFMQAILFCTNAQNLILNGSFENNSCNVSSTGSTYEGLLNSSYDNLIFNSWAFGTDGNIDILKLNSNFCGAAQDGIWYAGLTSGGTDAFSFKLSSSIIQNNIYSLSFYSRKYTSVYPGCPVKIGISNTDTLFGTLIYTSLVPPDTCQWTQSSFSFTAPLTAQYITVTCGGPNNSSSDWIHVDNFVLDTGNYMGIEQIKNKAEVNLYPNPNNGSMTLEYNISKDARLEITDITGNLVTSYNLPATENNMQIRNENLPNGVYLYRVICNNAAIKLGKIVIMK